MKLVIAVVAAAAGFLAARAMPRQDTKPEPSDRGRVTGIGGIFFKAQDPKKLSAWYRENLGLDVRSGPAEMALFKWHEIDDAKRVGTTVWSLFRSDTKYFGPNGAPFMIDYRVRNLDGLLAQLKEKGVAVEDRISKDSTGRFAWAMDPEGNRIELWEPGEGR